jgi:hypothetical protein
MRSLSERVKCSCLNQVTHSRELESSLKNKNQGLDLREREGDQTLDLNECFAFLSGQQLKRVGGGL